MELFGRTLDHVDDKKAIWKDFRPPVDRKKDRGEVSGGSAVGRRWFKKGL